MIQSTLSIGDATIRHIDGLFSLNDLHRASGGMQKHEPNQFTRLEQTQALIDEIKSADSRNCIETRRGRHNGGTWVCRELVIAYAAWISAAFHLKVIRVFLAQHDKPAPKYSGVRLSELIAAGNGVYIETEELQRISVVCMEKLAQRASFYQARLAQAGKLAQLV
jgi:hypothetical protein